MTDDEGLATKAIRQPVETKDAIQASFDTSITYNKGSSVLNMFERWVGDAAWQRFLRSYYVRAFAWKNARAADFLGVMKGELGEQVATAYDTFLEQPGVPVIEHTLLCDGKPRLDLTQHRSLPRGVDRHEASPMARAGVRSLRSGVASRIAAACSSTRRRERSRSTARARRGSSPTKAPRGTTDRGTTSARSRRYFDALAGDRGGAAHAAVGRERRCGSRRARARRRDGARAESAGRSRRAYPRRSAGAVRGAAVERARRRHARASTNGRSRRSGSRRASSVGGASRTTPTIGKSSAAASSRSSPARGTNALVAEGRRSRARG